MGGRSFALKEIDVRIASGENPAKLEPRRVVKQEQKSEEKAG